MISKSNEIYKLSTYRTKLVKYHEIADLLTKVPKCCFINTKNMMMMMAASGYGIIAGARSGNAYLKISGQELKIKDLRKLFSSKYQSNLTFYGQ